MSSSRHLVLFDGFRKEEDLPEIGTRLKISEELMWKACLASAHLPFTVTVESYHRWGSSGTNKGFFGLLESSNLTEEQVIAFKKRGLFQTPILPAPEDLKSAPAGVDVDIWVFQTRPHLDLDRFKRAFLGREGLEQASHLIFKDFAEGRENWQEVDWEQEWIRNLNKDETLINTANTYAFILLGDFDYDSKENSPESDASQDIIKVVIPLLQRKDPIRTFRCTVEYAGGILAAMAGLGRTNMWYEDGIAMKEVDPVVRD